VTRRRTNQFDKQLCYGEKVAPLQRLEWSSSCYICVLIFIIFYMSVVFGVMVSFASLLTAFHTLFHAFSRAFLPLCAPLPPAVCEKTGPAFLNESAALRG
jgi:hypothetical protein